MKNTVYILECDDRLTNMCYVLGVFQNLPKIGSVQRLVSNVYGKSYNIDDSVMECLYYGLEYQFDGIKLYCSKYNVEDC